MNYGLKYIVPFKSLRGNDVKIHILLQNYEGESVQLQGAGSPLVVNIEDEDFLYTPTRSSSCKISVYGSDYLQEIYSTGHLQWKINIFQNNKLVWTGYIKPEVYTQDYTNPNFELQIEGISILEASENIEFTRESSYSKFTSLFNIIKRFIKATNGDWNNVYIPKTYGKSENILEDLRISEANFFDEENEPMKWSEVMTDICRILNWTAVDWNGKLIFYDVDFKSKYRKYDLGLTNYSLIEKGTKEVQEIGFMGANHTYDRLRGYNKASVRVSNYNINEVLPALDFDDLKEVDKGNGSDGFKHNTRRQLLEDGNWSVFHYNTSQEQVSEDIWKDKADESLGSSFARTFSWTVDRGEDLRPKTSTNKYDYRDVIFVRTTTQVGDTVYRLKNKEIIKCVRKDALKFARGSIDINFQVEALEHYNKPRLENQLFAGDKTNGITHIDALLRIGNLWWNGTWWTDKETRFKIELNNDSETGYMNIVTNKELFEGPNDATGYVINLWSERTSRPPFDKPKPNIGDLEFILYSSDEHFKRNNIGGYNISGLSVEFTPIDKDNETHEDRIYENVVNEDYIEELDEIEVKISTYNDDGMAHSKLLLNDEYLTDNLYCHIIDDDVRLEELLIRRIKGQYSKPKTKLTQQLKLTPLSVLTTLTDKTMPNVTFMIAGGQLDFKNDVMELEMIEDGRY